MSRWLEEVPVRQRAVLLIVPVLAFVLSVKAAPLYQDDFVSFTVNVPGAVLAGLAVNAIPGAVALTVVRTRLMWTVSLCVFVAVSAAIPIPLVRSDDGRATAATSLLVLAAVLTSVVAAVVDVRLRRRRSFPLRASRQNCR